MLSNGTNQPKLTVELGYMCPRGLTGPPAVDVFINEILLQIILLYLMKLM